MKYLSYLYQKGKSLLNTDKKFTKRRFFDTFGYKLNLRHPKSFNEKMQWIKLYDRRNLMTRLSDKLLVRDYVEKKVGSKYLNKLINVYDDVDSIDISKLPDKFALKANHGSGWNVICDNKKKLNWKKSKKLLKKWLSENYYTHGREWCYKNIKPNIICEKYLGKNIYDYKLFCFNGKVKYIQVDVDRFTNHTRCFYDIKWKKQPFTTYFPLYKGAVKKPSKLKKMIDIAEKLSDNFYFTRIDLYLVKNKILFGEITFYHGNGFEKFFPNKFDLKMGNLLDLS